MAIILGVFIFAGLVGFSLGYLTMQTVEEEQTQLQTTEDGLQRLGNSSKVVLIMDMSDEYQRSALPEIQRQYLQAKRRQSIPPEVFYGGVQ